MTGIDLLDQLIRRARDNDASELALHPDQPAVSVETDRGVFYYFVDDTEVTCAEAIQTLEAAYRHRQIAFGLERKQAGR